MEQNSAFFQIAVMGAFVVALAVFALWGEGRKSKKDGSLITADEHCAQDDIIK